MAEGEDVINPVVEYMDCEKDPENYLKVCVDIPGLKKKTMGNAAKNADVKLEADERSFTVTVTVRLTKESKKYVFTVKQLPEAINPDPSRSFTKVKRKDEVIVFLNKARPGKWARMLSATGLETFNPEKT